MTIEECARELEFIRSLYSEIGYEGPPHSPSSAVLGMLYQFHPDNPEYEDGYRQLVETFLKDKSCKTVSIDRHQFYARIKDLCRGIVYAYQHMRKREGDDCLKGLSSYFLSIEAQFGEDSRPSDNFYAGVLSDGQSLQLTIASRLIGLHALEGCRMNDRVFQDDKIDGLFNAREMAILTGIEEGVHAIQMNRKLKGHHAGAHSVTYLADDVMAGNPQAIHDYQNDAMEREAKEVLEYAARDLKLGSNYARVQTSSKGELPPK